MILVGSYVNLTDCFFLLWVSLRPHNRLFCDQWRKGGSWGFQASHRQEHIQEVKALANPPAGVRLACEGVCIMFHGLGMGWVLGVERSRWWMGEFLT